MAFLKLLIVLLVLITNLKAASINVEENATEETATMNVRAGLVPTIDQIGKAMLPISDRLNENLQNIIQNDTNHNASVGTRFSLFKNYKNDLEQNIKEKAYHRVKHLAQITFKATIEGIVDIIRKTNSLPKLLYINFLIYFGLALGYIPGFLIFIGYKSILTLLDLYRIPSTLLKPVHNFIQGMLMKLFPNIVDFLRKLVAQACSRGLSFILNHIKKRVEFDYVT